MAKKKSKRKQTEKRARKKEWARRRRRLLVTGISLLLLVALALPVFITGGRMAPTRPTESPAARGTEAHWHVGLSVTVDGQPLSIPNLENDRFLDIHDTATTLPQALAVYGVRLTETCLNENCTDDGGRLTVSVNGQPMEDFTRYLLRQGDEVRIEFSKAVEGRRRQVAT